jgi:Flp pilus assembly protein TadB
VKSQNFAVILIYLAVIAHLLVLSGWVVTSMVQPLQLATLAFLLIALFAMRKKKRKSKKRTRKPPAEVNEMVDRAADGKADK